MSEEPVYEEVPPEPEPFPEPEPLPTVDYGSPQEPAKPTSNKTVLIIVGVIVGVLILCCCFAFFVLPLLGGPIEEIFEDIVEGLEGCFLSYYA